MVQRQAQRDHRAPAQRALDVHGAVQRRHDGIHQRKADAAAPHRVAALVELGLDIFQIFRRDAAALIDDLHKQKEYNVLQGTVNGFATAVGFTISIVLMAGIREKIAYNDIPKSFQGFPTVLLTAGLMAIAFFGFSGLI